MLVAQPILDLHTEQVRRYELLLRMLDERDDLIPPAAFLSIAERFGSISRIDPWIASAAIDLIAEHPELHLEIDISGRLRSSRIDPTHLIFEVTETAAVANVTHAQAFAQHLRDRGCRFALDDRRADRPRTRQGDDRRVRRRRADEADGEAARGRRRAGLPHGQAGSALGDPRRRDPPLTG